MKPCVASDETTLPAEEQAAQEETHPQSAQEEPAEQAAQELTEEQFHRLTDKFSPYRTTAALYFWYYANPACRLVLP